MIMALEESSAVVDSLTSSDLDVDLDLDVNLNRPVESSSSSSPPPSDPVMASLSRNSSLSKLNAQAPAFVPRSSSSPSLSSASLSSSSSSSRGDLKQQKQQGRVIAQPGQALMHVYCTPPTSFHPIVPVQSHFLYAPQLPVQYPYGGGVGGFVDPAAGQEVAAAAATPAVTADSDHPAKSGGLTEEATQKIVNQVEFYFSDLNLATTDHLIRLMVKDPEGYVPLSVVAAFKKIKALIGSHAQLAKVLRSSTKLVVSEDGKKVKRRNTLTETDLEELQSRIVVAENLPGDHCHQNLMKIFSAVGSVKMIRTCQPQTSNGGASSASRSAKSESMLYSNKLHAFVEYDSVELAEKAVVELSDADNWRNGLKVRLLLRRTAKSCQSRGKKVGHEGELKEDDALASEVNEKHHGDSRHDFDAQSSEIADVVKEEHGSGGPRKGHNRGRGKVHGPGQAQGQGRGRPQFQQNNRGGHGGAPTSSVNRGSSVASVPSNTNRVSLGGQPAVLCEQSASGKQSSVPRMPDGTRGFSLGRGKPVVIKSV